MACAGQPWAVSRTCVLSLAGISKSRALNSFSGLHNVLQAQISNFSDFFKRGFDLLHARMLQANGKRFQNGFLFVQAGANDERKSELIAIILIEFLKGGNFLRR